MADAGRSVSKPACTLMLLGGREHFRCGHNDAGSLYGPAPGYSDVRIFMDSGKILLNRPSLVASTLPFSELQKARSGPL
jgi:hypothetical protein